MTLTFKIQCKLEIKRVNASKPSLGFKMGHIMVVEIAQKCTRAICTPKAQNTQSSGVSIHSGTLNDLMHSLKHLNLVRSLELTNLSSRSFSSFHRTHCNVSLCLSQSFLVPVFLVTIAPINMFLNT